MADTDTFSAQTVVIGAGVVGLAIARALALQGREVMVLEAGPRFGEGLSSRNSEVIHGGLYYPEQSLKAKLCVQGRQALYDYCQARHLPFRKCGKWIVARDEEVDQLTRIQRKRMVLFLILLGVDRYRGNSLTWLRMLHCIPRKPELSTATP